MVEAEAEKQRDVVWSGYLEGRGRAKRLAGAAMGEEEEC